MSSVTYIDANVQNPLLPTMQINGSLWNLWRPTICINGSECNILSTLIYTSRNVWHLFSSTKDIDRVLKLLSSTRHIDGSANVLLFPIVYIDENLSTLLSQTIYIYIDGTLSNPSSRTIYIDGNLSTLLSQTIYILIEIYQIHCRR